MRTNRHLLKRWILPTVVGAAFLIPALVWRAPGQAADDARPRPASHRVQAIYFHRTHRCPTCKRISAYIEEGLKTGLPRELKDGRLAMYMIDFQDPKNERYSKAYQISGPTLVLVNVHADKVTEWKPMPKVWSLVAKKAEFFKYVQDGVHGYLEGP